MAYLLYSVAGVTGERSGLPAHLSDFVARVRAATDKPLSVGFGISTAEQVGEVAGMADGVVVGSAFMNAVDEVCVRVCVDVCRRAFTHTDINIL